MMVDGDGWRMLRGEAQGGTGWDGRMVGSMNGDKGTGEGSRWMLRYCRHRPLLPLPSFPHPGACRRGNTEIHRLHTAPLASAEALEQFSGPRQRNESSAPARPVGGVVMEGAQAVAARSPALRAPQTWTRWTVESLEQTECGIPATSSSKFKFKSAPTSKASRSSSRSQL